MKALLDLFKQVTQEEEFDSDKGAWDAFIGGLLHHGYGMNATQAAEIP